MLRLEPELEDALRKYQPMKKSLSPLELMERYGGDPNAAVRNYTELATDQAAKDSKRDANKAKSKQLVTKLKSDMRELLKGEKLPDGTVRRTKVADEIAQILTDLDKPDSTGVAPGDAVERIRTLVIEQIEVARNEKQFPGSEILTDVDVYSATDISLDEFAKLPNSKKQGMTRRTIEGVTRIYRKVTDIDLLVVSGKKAQKMEQIKTGENDRPGAATAQNANVIKAIEAARASGEKLIFETPDGRDVTAKIDVTSLSTDISVTVGPANAGFKESLDYVAADLERTIKEFVDERGIEPNKPPPHKGGAE